jgi:YegS/Rv2252/BmrU family lipid kinase
MPASYATVIVNPMAGGHSASKEWPKMMEQLRNTGLSFEFEFTRKRGHAAEIAARAIDEGKRLLVAVGGDGTVSEVANAMLRSGKAADLALGIVPAGTAHALVYSLGISEDYARVCSNLATAKKISIDVGIVSCQSRGCRVEQFFVNEASAGLSAEIVDSWRTVPAQSGRGANLPLRTVAGLRAAASHQNKVVKLRVGDNTESPCLCSIFVANGRYCADKMLIAPHASLDDGFLDVIIAANVSKAELLRIRPTLYDGTHLRHAKISEKKVTEVTVEAEEPLLVEADGDVIGQTPASFRIMPLALNVLT